MNILDTFKFALDAILPIILLIVLGYILKRIHFLNEGFLKVGNAFVYKVCLPCLLFYNVYSIDSFSSIDWSVVLYSEIFILLAFLIGAICCKLFMKDPKQKGVVLQCIFRSNYAIIGISLAQALGGSSGLMIASVLSAFSIPTFNILAVLALTMYNTGEEKEPLSKHILKTLKGVATNPLIIGVVIGLIVVAIRYAIPVNANGEIAFSLERDCVFFFKAIKDLGTIASPLALIILGGTFDFAAIKGMIKPILGGTLPRVVFVPLIAIGSAVLLSKYTSIINFGPEVYPALIALFGSPVAVSSAIMAEQMGNDGKLASQLVVWTSLLSIFTIFITVVLLRSMSLL